MTNPAGTAPSSDDGVAGTAASTDDGVDADPETASALVEVEEQISALTTRVRIELRDAAAKVDPSLSPFGFKLLRLLLRGGPLSPGAAAEHLVVDRSVISRQVRQLEDLGLVELRADPDDGRARILGLTPDAVERLGSVAPAGATMLRHLLAGWTAEDLRAFSRYIARMNEPRS